MTSRVFVGLFGSFRVEVDDRALRDADWPRRRPLELVQLLALTPGHALLRDQVIDALWPQLDIDAGAANLRKAAHHARQVLGDPDAVVLRGGQVRLFPDADVDTDLARFRAAAETALASGDRAACAAAADLAVEEFLPGAVYEDWSADARNEIRSTALSLLRTAGAWERLAEIDPLDEAAHQELMRAAIDAGARSEAVRLFGQIRDVLATELGVQPGPDTVALYEEAVAGHEAVPVELVGRDEEVAAARSVLMSPPGSTPTVVTVRGSAGIGKSTFCKHVAELARLDGLAVHWTDAAVHTEAFGPLIRLVEQVVTRADFDLEDLTPHARSVLASMTPIIGAPDVGLPITRHQVLGAIVQVLSASAGGRRSVLILDDAHDADDATIDVLVHMATSVPDLFVVFAFRPASPSDELVRGLDRLTRAGRVADIALDGLSTDAATHLARRAAIAELGDEEVHRIVERAGGNPFAVCELAGASVGGGELPASTATAITSRLVGLDAERATALQRLALGRGELDPTAVVALTGLDEPAAFDLLDHALDAGVLVVDSGRYRFRHDLVREALAAQVPPHRRMVAHRSAARRLAAAGAPPAAVAAHWLEAGEPEEAVEPCVAAAKNAMQVGAFRDARRHLEPVLAHDPSHATALQLDAECLDMLGEPAALAAYDRAIAVADADVADDLVIARAMAQIKQGDAAGGLAAVQGATPHSMMGRLNQALTYAGAAALGATDPSIGTEKAEEVRRLALRAGDRAGIVIAAWAHAAAAHARGDLHDSVIGDLRETKDLPHLAVRVFDGHLCMTQRFLYGSRPYPEVISFAESLTSEAERLGAARGQAFGMTLRSEALFLSGHFDDAREGFESGLALHRETGGTTGEAHALSRLADLIHVTGDLPDAKAVAQDALERARVSDIGFHLLDRIYGSRIRMSIGTDDALAAVDESEDAIRGPLETCPGCRIHRSVPAAIACAQAGDLERAHEYAEAVDYDVNVVMRLPAWYAAFDEVLANVALAEGDRDRALDLFASAADKYAAAGHPFDEARCRAAG